MKKTLLSEVFYASSDMVCIVLWHFLGQCYFSWEKLKSFLNILYNPPVTAYKEFSVVTTKWLAFIYGPEVKPIYPTTSLL